MRPAPPMRAATDRPSLVWRAVAIAAGFFLALTLIVLTVARAGPQNTSQAAATAVAQSPDANAGAPAALLLARRKVSTYFDGAANMVCAESVSQAIVGKNGKPIYREDSVFDYQLQASVNNGSLKLTEFRETRKASFRDAARTLLITSGFTSMLLIVHPDYENSYVFEPDGEEPGDSGVLERVRFKAVPGASSPAAMQLRGQSYPIPFSGTLWIDPRTGAVSKLVASVDASLADLGLQAMRSEIHYGMMQFHDPEEAYWMPISATIDVETPRQHWRNVHRFGGCKRFRATIKIEADSKP